MALEHPNDETDRIEYSGMGLTCVPDIFAITNIQCIDLSENALTSLPETVFRGAYNLQELNLQKNCFVALHETIFQDTKRLTKLILSNNAFTTLPETLFAHTPNLEVLYMHHNLVSYLSPKLFQYTKNLHTAWFSNNCFHDVSFEIFQYTPHIRRVSFSNNLLQSVPKDCHFVSGMDTLWLWNNPIRVLSLEVLECVKSYLYISPDHLLFDTDGWNRIQKRDQIVWNFYWRCVHTEDWCGLGL